MFRTNESNFRGCLFVLLFFCFEQQSSVILLAKATNFMAVQFSSNSIHDQKLAQNISSVLLSSIGNVLSVSSHNARLNTKKGVGQEVSAVSDLGRQF